MLAKAVKGPQAAVQDNTGNKTIADAAEALLKSIATFKDVAANADAGQSFNVLDDERRHETRINHEVTTSAAI
jgi:hypothetical protein